MLKCDIISPEKLLSYTNLQSIILPAYGGRMQVLVGHAESFILLRRGNVLLKKRGKIHKRLYVDGGECYIKNTKVVIIL